MPRHILNTRPKHQAVKLTHALEAAGNTVFHLPVLDIQPVVFSLPDIHAYDTVIFLSANAVSFFFKQAPHINLSKKSVIAIGPATHRALTNHNIHAIVPKVFSSEGILTRPELATATHILIISGKDPKPLLQNTLQRSGRTVEQVACYQRCLTTYDMSMVFPKLEKANIDIIITTSLNSLQHLLHLFGKKSHEKWLLSKTLCVISAEMMKTAETAGFSKIIQATNATDQEIIKSLRN